MSEQPKRKCMKKDCTADASPKSNFCSTHKPLPADAPKHVVTPDKKTKLPGD